LHVFVRCCFYARPRPSNSLPSPCRRQIINVEDFEEGSTDAADVRAPPPDGRENDIIVAAADAADADEAALEDAEDETAMPPKKVPAAAAAAAAKKAASAAALKTGEETDDLPLPAVKKIPKPFHLDVHDGGIVAYYNEGGTDFAEVAMHVNGVLPKGACRMRLAEDGMSVTWQRSILQVCFAKEHLRAIMKTDYNPSHNRVIAYDKVAQQMGREKVTPDAAGLFWGGAQVIPLTFKATGTPKVTRIRYPIGEYAERNGKSHLQFNSIYYCKVQLAEQRSSNMAEVDCETVDLFDIPSSQGSSDYPGSPPPRGSGKKRRRVIGGHRVSASRRDEDEGLDDDAY
jgi:hypothetical protein